MKPKSQSIALTDRQLEVLQSLISSRRVKLRDGEGWCRPMDVGGMDGSHHCATLRQLVELGFAKRRLRYTLINEVRLAGGREGYKTSNRPGRARGSFVYQSTPRGALALGFGRV